MKQGGTISEKNKLVAAPVNAFFPPREIAKYEPSEELLEQAQSSFKAKHELLANMEYILFSSNFHNKEGVSKDDIRQLRKDQRNYLKLITTKLHRKFPAELWIGEKQIRQRARTLKRRAQVVLNDKPRKKRNKGEAEQEDKKEQDEDRYEQLDLDKIDADQPDSELDNLSDMPDEDSEGMGDQGDYGDDM